MAVVRYERQEQVAVITLDRPTSLNALTPELRTDLIAAFDQFAQEEDALVAVLTGAGRAFCAGMDMKYAAEAVRRGESGSGLGGPMPSARAQAKPVIAAVNGPVAGGGVSIVLGCDLVLASETAQFVLPFAARGRGGATVALDMARKTTINVGLYAGLTASRIDVQTALRLGLIHEVLPPDDLMPRALELAEKIAGFSQTSVRNIKQALNRALEVGFQQAMIETAAADHEVRGSDDMREGTIAFDEKRRAQFQSSATSE